MKPVRWLGSSRDDMREMPKPVRAELGFKLEQLEQGFSLAPPHAKHLAGYQPAVDELIENHDGDTYRAIVTVRLEDAIYVLHAFKKKSKHGIGMTKQDQELIAARLREAIADHENRRQRAQKGDQRDRP